MKALVILLAFLGFAVGAYAQATVTHNLGTLSSNADYTARLWPTNDTLTNADTLYYDYRINGSKAVNTVEIKINKTSGTVAGAVIIYGSIDGGLTWAQIDTDTLTDATNQYWYILQHNDYRDYRIRIVTSGTQASWAAAYLLYRQ